MNNVLTSSQVQTLRAALCGRRLVVCFGAGVDSTAMLVALKAAAIRPDLITFANTGAEKPETIAHRHRMDEVLRGFGFPLISEVCNKPKPTTGYSDLEGNCLKNETLPSLAFGMKSCSIKWKQVPQDQYLLGVKSGPNKAAPHPLWVETKTRGERIVKLVGYDAGPADSRRSKKMATASDEHFDYVYPLQLLGWTRRDCVRAIAEALGPSLVPIKSACFFCPASKQWELYWLAGSHPELFERALKIERVALTGKHSRFDSLHFGDTWENLVRNAASFPSSNTSVGLGRSFAWNQWAITHGVVDANFRVRRDRLAEFQRTAAALNTEDNALDVRACA